MNKPTVQDIFQRFYPAYLEKYFPSPEQAKVARNIMNCKTGAYGANVSVCEDCGAVQIHYNSCRNRCCPMCQAVPKEMWMDARREDVLDSPYFHLVFTVPDILNPVIYSNQKLLYDTLYHAASATISELTADPAHLGAAVGYICILHTWGSEMNFHPHIHTILLGGGLTFKNEWKDNGTEFFLPIWAISKVFRGKYMDEKKRLLQTGVFKNESDIVLFLLVRQIGHRTGPVGSWTLKEELDSMGIAYGTATVGRYLKMLDYKGYTIHKGNQGRILSDEGKKWLSDMEDSLNRAEVRNESSKALQVNKYSDLIDLMKARKAIEVETVRLAAIHATQEEITELRKSINIYYRFITEKKDFVEPALDFHGIIADMSHNRFMKAILEMLIFEEKQIEDNIDQLETRKRGNTYVIEHDDITRAIEERNPDLAAELMDRHMEGILEAVEYQVNLMEKVE